MIVKVEKYYPLDSDKDLKFNLKCKKGDDVVESRQVPISNGTEVCRITSA